MKKETNIIFPNQLFAESTLLENGNEVYLIEEYLFFKQLFIDAYDWVMVPNVYGMSQFSDGGTFATKPYVGGSNYIKKMSNYPKGDWQPIWDGLFWRFIDKHQEFFKSNPRTSMLFYSYNRMSEEKRVLHLENAEAFLEVTVG